MGKTGGEEGKTLGQTTTHNDRTGRTTRATQLEGAARPKRAEVSDSVFRAGTVFVACLFLRCYYIVISSIRRGYNYCTPFWFSRKCHRPRRHPSALSITVLSSSISLHFSSHPSQDRPLVRVWSPVGGGDGNGVVCKKSTIGDPLGTVAGSKAATNNGRVHPSEFVCLSPPLRLPCCSSLAAWQREDLLARRRCRASRVASSVPPPPPPH